MKHRLVVILLLACTAYAPAARGQSIAGRALAATDRQPIKHAFVVLLDQQGQARGGALSDSAGRWLIPAPTAGRYRLRLERIGFENVTSDVLELGDSLTIFDFIVGERPFTIAAIRAETGGRGCGERSDGTAVYRLWEEIQKALRLTKWTETNNALTFTTMTYVRELSPGLSNVQRETRNMRRALAAAPFRTEEPAVLMQNGFSRDDGEDLILFGVDARVLLSPEFMEHYCFRLQTSPQANLIGLGFEPIRRRNATDVRGVLWVDRQTAELRHLAYAYFNMPRALRAYGANAEVHFRKLNTGLWVIDRWWIRAPRIQERIGNIWAPASRNAIELAGYREDGGVLMAAESRTRAFFELVGGATLLGTVTGRPPHAPPIANVMLSSTSFSALTDYAGYFRIAAVPPGTYAVTVRDALLDDLRVQSQLDTVVLVAGQATTRNVRWPTQQEILRSVCPGEEEEASNALTAVLYGDVLHATTGRPLNNARVWVSWNGFDPGTGAKQFSRTGFSGSDGRYYVCWIPYQTNLTVEVTASDVPPRRLELNLPAPVQRQDVR